MKWLDNAWWIGMEHLIGIQCPATPDEPYHMLILQKDQHRIRVKYQAESIDIAAVQAQLKRYPKWPIVIALGSDFVMEATLAPDQMSDPISAVLGVKIDDHDDFEYMATPTQDGQHQVAIIRKETIQAAISPLAKDQERIIHINFSAQGESSNPERTSHPERSEGSSASHKNAERSEASNPKRNSHPERSEGSSKQPTIAERSAGTNISLREIPTSLSVLARALTLLWSNATKAPHLPWQEKLQNYIAISRLRQIAVVSAAALAVWFLTLFFLRTRLESEKGTLEEAYAQNLPVFNAINKLDEKIQAREALNQELGGQTLRASKASFYLDRLAAIVPEEITLTEMTVGPDEEDFKRQGIREATDHNIILRGECDRSAPVTTFSQAIEQIPWVQAIAIPKSELYLQGDVYEFVFLVKTTNANPAQ